MKMKNKAGFSLIELMIAVAVVGILASIAYPSYRDYVVRSNRADAMGELQQAATAMERYFTVNGSYNGATAGTTIPSQLPRTGTALYNITLNLTPSAGNPKTGFTILATPVSTQPQKNDGKIEIDHTGRKRWDEKNNGWDSADNNWKKD